MEQRKNIAGIIGLCAALLSLVCIVLAAAVPMGTVNVGKEVPFYGQMNVTVAVAGIVLGLAAIIVSAVSLKNKDKKGPRKSGLIIGIIAFIISFGSYGIAYMMAGMGDYMNGKPSYIDQIVDETQKAQLDEMMTQIKQELAKYAK